MKGIEIIGTMSFRDRDGNFTADLSVIYDKESICQIHEERTINIIDHVVVDYSHLYNDSIDKEFNELLAIKKDGEWILTDTGCKIVDGIIIER